MKKSQICHGTLAGLAIFFSAARGDALTLDLNNAFNGAAPVGATPWLTATFTDVVGGVQLTMAAPGLTGSEFVSLWYFNLNPAKTATSLTFSSAFNKVGTFTDPTAATSGNGQWNKADGTGGNFDIVFSFGTASGSTFTSGESVSFLISGIAGLSASDFDFGADNSGYQTAAHIQSLSTSGNSTWINGSPRTDDIPGVPDGGATVALLGIGLSGLTIAARRIRK